MYLGHTLLALRRSQPIDEQEPIHSRQSEPGVGKNHAGYRD